MRPVLIVAVYRLLIAKVTEEHTPVPSDNLVLVARQGLARFAVLSRWQ